MSEDAIGKLAENGPWAVVAGVLLYQLIKAWSDDRAALTKLYTEFQGTLASLSDAVEGLRNDLFKK